MFCWDNILPGQYFVYERKIVIMQKIVLVKRCLDNNAVICKFFKSEASLYSNIHWDRYCIF